MITVDATVEIDAQDLEALSAAVRELGHAAERHATAGHSDVARTLRRHRALLRALAGPLRQALVNAQLTAEVDR